MQVKPKVEPMNEPELLKLVQFHSDHAIYHLKVATDLIQRYKKNKNETHK